MDIDESKLTGRGWAAVINGRRSLNGQRHSAQLSGNIEAAPDGVTIYDVMRELIDHLEEHNAEMEYPDSIRITLMPPPSDRSNS
jgi:hypothetical protein